MTANHLDALVYPTNSVSIATGVDTHGVPVALEFLGKNWSDGKLLASRLLLQQAALGTAVGSQGTKGVRKPALRSADAVSLGYAHRLGCV